VELYLRFSHTPSWLEERQLYLICLYLQNADQNRYSLSQVHPSAQITYSFEVSVFCILYVNFNDMDTTP